MVPSDLFHFLPYDLVYWNVRWINKTLDVTK